MTQLNNTIVNKAIVTHMNRNSVTLELAPNETIMCTRRVFNEIRKNPDIPMYSVQREFQGKRFNWIAIPLTL